MQRIVFLTLVISVLLFSCTPQREDTFEPYDWPVGEIDDLLSLLREPMNTNVGISTDTLCVEGPSKQLIKIFPSTLENASGQVSTGDISIASRFLKSKRDFIVHRLSSISTSGMYIDLNGASFLQVSNISESLMLSNGKSYSYYIVDDNFNDSAERFNGITTNNFFSWVESDGDFNIQDNVWNSTWISPIDTSAQSGYETDAYQLGWQSVGNFISVNNPVDQKVCLELPEGYDFNNTLAYISLTSHNVAVEFIYDQVFDQFCRSYLPMGHEITITTITNFKSGDYRLGTATIIVDGSQQVTITPEQMSLLEIETYLQGL